MTEQAKKAQSAIKYLSDDVQGLASPLDDGLVTDTNSVVANEVRLHAGPIGPAPPPESIDRRPTVKRIWLALTDPDRPGDSVSADYRVGLISYLEKLMRTDFASTADLRQHVERFLDGYDGRRLPIPEAIKRARKKLKLTQRQLAELMGFKNHTLISKYESGKRVPPAMVLEWLSGTENVTGKRQLRGNSRTPSFVVTSNRRKGACISPTLSSSETSQEREECTPSDSGHPNSTPEVL